MFDSFEYTSGELSYACCTHLFPCYQYSVTEYWKIMLQNTGKLWNVERYGGEMCLSVFSKIFWSEILTSTKNAWRFTGKVYLEHSRTSMIECFVEIINRFISLTIFAQKLHHRCSSGFYIRLCYLGNYLLFLIE